MDSNIDYKDMIERFLDGEMSEIEQINFKKELETNRVLAHEFDFYSLAGTFVAQNKIASLKERIGDAKAEYTLEKQKQRTQKMFLGTGIILALITIGFFAWDTQKATDTRSIKTLEKQEKLIADKAKEEKYQVKVSAAKKEIIEGNKQISSPIENKNTSVSANNVVLNSPKVEAEKVDVKEDAKAVSTQNTAKEEKPTLLDPCSGVQISFQLLTNKSCIGKDNGDISILGAKGGTAPYVYVLNDKEKSKQGSFTQLKGGKHIIQVVDANNCKSSQELVVKEELCKIDLYMSLSDRSAVHFPINENFGELTIFDKMSEVKFVKAIEQNEDFEWFGDTNAGKLTQGYYVFVIKYKDGTVQKGSVTIAP